MPRKIRYIDDLIGLDNGNGLHIVKSRHNESLIYVNSVNMTIFELEYCNTDPAECRGTIEKLNCLNFDLVYDRPSDEELNELSKEDWMKSCGIDLDILRSNVDWNDTYKYITNPYSRLSIYSRSTLCGKAGLLYYSYYLHEYGGKSKIGLKFHSLRMAGFYRGSCPKIILLGLDIDNELDFIWLKPEDKLLFVLKNNKKEYDTPYIIAVRLDSIMPYDLENVIERVVKNTDELFKKFTSQDNNVYELVGAFKVDSSDLKICGKEKTVNIEDKKFKERNTHFSRTGDLPESSYIKVYSEEEILNMGKGKV